MEVHIISRNEDISSRELIGTLEQHFSRQGIVIPLQIKVPDLILKGVDPTVLVASVGAGGALLGTLIKGLLQVLKEKYGQRIHIVTPSGTIIDAPANASPKRLEQIIEMAQKLDQDSVQIVVE